MTCPICKKTTSETDSPFCSARCKDIDLGKWLIGGYVIANDDETESSKMEYDSEESDG
jgi:endogenous inhibitor of DNA gyrase (YacG/DUF329 family)|tara:strand:- start:65 stop:238 length:174 start_codon:yes stop_codon:yes gene_type:complete